MAGPLTPIMVAAARLAANKGVQAAVKKFGKKVVDEAQDALEGAILSSVETTMVTQARGYAMKDVLYGNTTWNEETKRLEVVAADQERIEPDWSFGIPTSPEDSYEQNVKKHHPHVTVQEDVPDQMTSYKPIPTAYSRSLRRELLGQKDDTRAKLGMIPSELTYSGSSSGSSRPDRSGDRLGRVTR